MRWWIWPHPTQKPEKLLAKIILAATNPGDVVLDPFLGSGTTAVVAKKLGRRYVGVEIDRDYAGLAMKRLEIAERDRSIQGYAEGVFWERNSAPIQAASAKRKSAERWRHDARPLFSQRGGREEQMRQSIFETAWYQTIEQRICDVLNAEKGYLSGSTARSTRAVGDAIQDILGDRFRSLIGDDVCKNYSKDFARRAMADLDAAHVRYSHRRILSTGTGQDRQED